MAAKGAYLSYPVAGAAEWVAQSVWPVCKKEKEKGGGLLDAEPADIKPAPSTCARVYGAGIALVAAGARGAAAWFGGQMFASFSKSMLKAVGLPEEAADFGGELCGVMSASMLNRLGR
jgi:hypothetical protein